NAHLNSDSSMTIRSPARIASNGSSTNFTPPRPPTTTRRPMTTTSEAPVNRIVDAIRSRQRFVISSHARPDGDSIGSQLAMAYALRALGKDVSIVNKDKAPGPMLTFPGVDGILIADEVAGEFGAAIIMECSDLARTGVKGLDRSFVI